MIERVTIQDISAGYRPIKDGSQYNRFFSAPDSEDRVILDNGDVDDTVELMKKVVWKYIDDTKEIAKKLRSKSVRQTCRNIWEFLYNHIQYRLDKKGVEQLRRPCRSWADRTQGIDCDCFSIFVSSILTNLQIPHSFRITKYGTSEVFQHVYVIVPQVSGYITIDCVLKPFNYEKPYSHKKDFIMNINGINVAVLSGIDGNVFDLVSGLEGLGDIAGAENDDAIYEHLVKTRTMIAQNPQLISSVEYTPGFLKMLDYAIENWNTPNRQKALDFLIQNEQQLNQLNGIDTDFDGFEDDIDEQFGKILPRIVKKVAKKLPKKNTTTAKSKAKATKPKKAFFKKVGEAVKKGGKAFVRYNPVTVSARGGFLLALKMNIKKMASKLQWAYKSKEEAAKHGISSAEWTKTKDALAKVQRLFVDKLQGKPQALKNAILSHASGLRGIDGELGAVSAATLAAALPIIASALKILVDSGIMKKEEAANLEAEIQAKTKNVSDADISAMEQEAGGDSEKGLLAFVKKQPLVAVGGAALGIWGISKLIGGKKKKSSSLGRVRTRSSRAKKPKPRSTRTSQKVSKVTFS